MKDRLHRPPPLELAPPKRQHKVAVPGERASTMSRPVTASTTARHAPPEMPYAPASPPRARRRPSGSSNYYSWLQLLSDGVQIHICAILVAALGTYLYEMPSAAGTRTGSTAMAAITLLTLSIFLSFLSMFRPHTPPNPWTLVVRLILAFSFVAIFLAWVAQVPGPRVFDPSYGLWGLDSGSANGLVAGVVFVLGVAEFIRAVVWRHTLLGETAQWRPQRTRRSRHHHRSSIHRQHHHHGGQRRRTAGRGEVHPLQAGGSWPLKPTATNTTLGSEAGASRTGPR